MLKIEDLLVKLNANLHVGSKDSYVPKQAFGSDLMSDVLTLEDDDILLITGLANPQTIRTAEMADISLIIIVRGKEVTEEMKDLAKENEITILSSPFSLFKVCGVLYQNGLKPIF